MRAPTPRLETQPGRLAHLVHPHASRKHKPATASITAAESLRAAMTKNTRREFLVATAGVGVWSVAGLAHARFASEKLNLVSSSSRTVEAWA